MNSFGFKMSLLSLESRLRLLFIFFPLVLLHPPDLNVECWPPFFLRLRKLSRICVFPTPLRSRWPTLCEGWEAMSLEQMVHDAWQARAFSARGGGGGGGKSDSKARLIVMLFVRDL